MPSKKKNRNFSEENGKKNALMLPQDHSTKSRNHSNTEPFAVANGSEHSPISVITQRHRPPQISLSATRAASLLFMLKARSIGYRKWFCVVEWPSTRAASLLVMLKAGSIAAANGSVW